MDQERRLTVDQALEFLGIKVFLGSMAMSQELPTGKYPIMRLAMKLYLDEGSIVF